MLLFDGFFGLVAIGLWIFCAIDAITTPAEAVRNLPKAIWVIIVILLMVPGAIIWLFAGRPWGLQRGGVRPTATVGSTRRVPTNPDDDEEFLAGLRARAEEQRRRAREADPGDPDRPTDPTG